MTAIFDLAIPYICAPYLPLLGPVNSNEITPELLKGIYEASIKNEVLSYDKNIRWSNHPSERIVEGGIEIVENVLVIRTATNTASRIYAYRSLSPKFLKLYPGYELITVSASRPAEGTLRSATIFIDELDNNVTTRQPILYAHELSDEEADVLASLGDHDSMSGFRHLIEIGAAKDSDHPIIIARRSGKIVGAIGPHQILADSKGAKRLLPCYFGVNSSARRQGVGKELWMASRQWAVNHDAKYNVLQAELGSDAEHFYISMGLKKLGYTTTSII